MWLERRLLRRDGGALYLDDVAVFDHFAQQLLVFRFILFLLQFCCMLKNTGTYYSFWLIIMLQELLRDLKSLPVTS